jgi:hypothetical protein
MQPWTQSKEQLLRLTMGMMAGHKPYIFIDPAAHARRASASAVKSMQQQEAVTAVHPPPDVSSMAKNVLL